MKKILFLLSFVIALSFFTQQVYAFNSENTGQGALLAAASAPVYDPWIFESPTGCSYASKPLNCWIKQAFNYASYTVGSIAVVAIMAAGVLYMASGGNPDRIKTAKSIMVNALAGVAVIILANWFFRTVLGTQWGG